MWIVVRICTYTLYACVYTIMLSKYRAIAKVSFVDYIRGGCELNLIVAIDFTVRSSDIINCILCSGNIWRERFGNFSKSHNKPYPNYNYCVLSSSPKKLLNFLLPVHYIIMCVIVCMYVCVCRAPMVNPLIRILYTTILHIR